MQEQLKTAQAQIAWLGESNSRLRNEVVSLAHQGAQANHDAYHDQLTCLPNRRLLLDRLNQALGQAVRQHKQVVLMLLDLDGFKAVNDKFGHAVGDKLLQAVAERLVACIRGADTACRYGGDEFVVMLPEINGQEHRANIERKIRVRLAAPYVVDGVEVNMSVSIGSAVFPVEAKNRSELIKKADTAMYQAKAGAPTRTNETYSLFIGAEPSV
jgi:diguanylate cyclase (GGDEF)-like protein